VKTLALVWKFLTLSSARIAPKTCHSRSRWRAPSRFFRPMRYAGVVLKTRETPGVDDMLPLGNQELAENSVMPAFSAILVTICRIRRGSAT
jgi:hypothetical protein